MVFGSREIPLEAQYLYRKALEIKNNGNHEEALRYLNMAVTLAPRFCNAFNAIGNCLDEMGLYTEAAGKYEQVLTLNPSHSEARLKLGLVQRKIGRDRANPRYAGALPDLPPGNIRFYRVR